MNTKIVYLYRDADNYKCLNEAVLEGEFDPRDLDMIASLMTGGEYFVPEQVGLHLNRPDDKFTLADHAWAELDPYEDICLTYEPPTIEKLWPDIQTMSWAQFIDNFKKIKNIGWKDYQFV